MWLRAHAMGARRARLSSTLADLTTRLLREGDAATTTALPGPPLKPTSRSAPPSASGGSQPTRAAAYTAEVARSAQSGRFAAAPCALRNDESESELEEE